MKAADARGKRLGRPATSNRIVGEIEALAASTNLSIRQIQSKIGGRASRSIRAIQIRPSNELSETLMYQRFPGEFGSANRTAVISQVA